jgi:hypothetical protein
MNPPDPDTLEGRVHRALRALPDQRAPLTLERRVIAEISRRAALPWWRRSFGHWPTPVRAGFLVVSVGAAAGIALGAMTFGTAFDAWPVAGSLLGRLAWVAPAGEFARTLGGALAALGRSIPSAWLYGAAAGLVGAYAALIALGAATHRLLSSSRSLS